MNNNCGNNDISKRSSSPARATDSSGRRGDGRDTLMSALRNNRRHPRQLELASPFPFRPRERTMRDAMRSETLMLPKYHRQDDTPSYHPEPDRSSSSSAIDPTLMLRMQRMGRRVWSLDGTTPHGESPTLSRSALLRVLEKAAEITTDDDIDNATTRDTG